ncbi:hypothetical protein BT96DRAFT_1018460 [Gymnopus androsaceus JB14]|uniref:Uncharacterized protein n=1 Tax=Gymnopus androsaceus JB14 TaxID=1447944 RepID=A0A6A4HTC9_9AGAR|nr:hypothetical protein BT96DRAFT_1018460 [Gymnopus androsaceus JB14]
MLSPPKHMRIEDGCIITTLSEGASYIEDKSCLPPRLATWCEGPVKGLSEEVGAAVHIVSDRYARSIRKNEVLGPLAGRLSELFKIIAKSKKLVDRLNGRWIVRGTCIVPRTLVLKMIKKYHDEVKRIRQDLEGGILVINLNEIARGGNLQPISAEGLPGRSASTTPTMSPLVNSVGDVTANAKNSHDGQRERQPGIRNLNSPSTGASTLQSFGQGSSFTAPAAFLPNSTTNSDHTARGDRARYQVGGQAEERGWTRTMSSPSIGTSTVVEATSQGTPFRSSMAIAPHGNQGGRRSYSSPSTQAGNPNQPMSQEAPSASLSHTRVGTLSLNTVGNDVNNTTVNDNSWHTGNGNTMVVNIGDGSAVYIYERLERAFDIGAERGCRWVHRLGDVQDHRKRQLGLTFSPALVFLLAGFLSCPTIHILPASSATLASFIPFPPFLSLLLLLLTFCWFVAVKRGLAWGMGSEGWIQQPASQLWHRLVELCIIAQAQAAPMICPPPPSQIKLSCPYTPAMTMSKSKPFTLQHGNIVFRVTTLCCTSYIQTAWMGKSGASDSVITIHTYAKASSSSPDTDWSINAYNFRTDPTSTQVPYEIPTSFKGISFPRLLNAYACRFLLLSSESTER